MKNFYFFFVPSLAINLFLLQSKRKQNFSFSFSFLSQGGEVVQETITSNINDDLIILEFQKTDGTLITQLLDFRNVSYCYASLVPHTARL